MTTTVATILADVGKTLQDEWHLVWDDQTELLAWLNQATAEIVSRDPAALTFNMPMQCVAGAKQTVPADATALIDVRRNLGPAGQDMGPVITNVPRDDMDAANPNWPMKPPAPPMHFAFDERNPKVFYLNPPPPFPWFVEIIYNAVPNDVTLTDVFPLPGMYRAPAEYFVIARALARRSAELDQQGMKLVDWYMGMFDKSLGATSASVTMNTPKDKVNRR